MASSTRWFQAPGGAPFPVADGSALATRIARSGGYTKVARPGGDPARTDGGPPPRSGKGSGKQAWADYAAGKIDPVPDGKGDIIAALEAAGVAVD